MPIEAGATYVFDLGYYDYGWWAVLDEACCRIVTRFKSNTPLREAKEQPLPQLVLLDLHLPGMHGLEVLRRMKSDRRLKRIPVVVLSGSQNDRDIHQAMRLGANAYLIKPLDFHRFAEVTPKLRFRWALL